MIYHTPLFYSMCAIYYHAQHKILLSSCHIFELNMSGTILMYPIGIQCHYQKWPTIPFWFVWQSANWSLHHRLMWRHTVPKLMPMDTRLRKSSTSGVIAVQASHCPEVQRWSEKHHKNIALFVRAWEAIVWTAVVFLLHQHQLQESSLNLWHAKRNSKGAAEGHICVSMGGQFWDSVRPTLSFLMLNDIEKSVNFISLWFY